MRAQTSSTATGIESRSGSNTAVHTASEIRAASELRDGRAAETRIAVPPSGLLIGTPELPFAGQLPALPKLLPLSPEAQALRILVVEDDAPTRRACCDIATSMGFKATGVADIPEAQALLRRQPVDLLLLDLRLAGGSGLRLLEEVRTQYPEISTVVMTAFATVPSAVEAMKIGAGDYLTKPFALEELTGVLERAGHRRQIDMEARKLRERLHTEQGMGLLIGRSPEMEKVCRILAKVAYSTHPVLILGESGTGKELVARAIHMNGPLAAKPFVTVDCGSLVPTLIESELFGHVKGAFTGAIRANEGLLAAAGGGTVFLDEIGELPLDLQAKLLRALQEKEVRPVGSTLAVPISARVLAATNRDLTTMVEQGRFRKDLYFRLNVVNLRIPPLRERRMDIAVLAAHFLERIQKESGSGHTFSSDALRLMTEYDWPGNVRELENAIERACALSSGPVLHMADLPTQLQDFRTHRQEVALTKAADLATLEAGSQAAGPGSGVVSIASMERKAILGTIEQLHGDKLMAAKLLGIGKTTLYRKLKEYGVSDGTDGVEAVVTD